MTRLSIRDVRAEMPNYEAYCGSCREGRVTGIAIHHSATADPITGLSMDDARTIFRYHVEALGWSHGGYHYLIHPTGLIDYALDEKIPAFHAGFSDPDDTLGLERGQYWNNHLIAICVLGWFERDRVDGRSALIPNRFTSPTPGQWRSLLNLVRSVMARYGLQPGDVKGHRELPGCRTRCPGANLDLDRLRAEVARREADSG